MTGAINIRETFATSFASARLEVSWPGLDLPSDSEMAIATARYVVGMLRRSIGSGRSVDGVALSPPSAKTISERERDRLPPVRPRTDRWSRRYPHGWLRASRSDRALNASGTLARKITSYRAGVSTAHVDAPPSRDIGAIERSVGATIFAMTKRHAADAARLWVRRAVKRRDADVERWFRESLA